MKTGKSIPISEAKRIANERGYTQVIIHAYDGLTNAQHVTTYGKSTDDSINAANGGNAIKRLLKWDEKHCNAKSSRQVKLEQLKVDNDEMLKILKMLSDLIDNPSPRDVTNLVKFVGVAVVAQNILKKVENKSIKKARPKQ